jgi:hypothetical protein
LKYPQGSSSAIIHKSNCSELPRRINRIHFGESASASYHLPEPSAIYTLSPLQLASCVTLIASREMSNTEQRALVHEPYGDNIRAERFVAAKRDENAPFQEALAQFFMLCNLYGDWSELLDLQEFKVSEDAFSA